MNCENCGYIASSDIVFITQLDEEGILYHRCFPCLMKHYPQQASMLTDYLNGNVKLFTVTERSDEIRMR